MSDERVPKGVALDQNTATAIPRANPNRPASQTRAVPAMTKRIVRQMDPACKLRRNRAIRLIAPLSPLAPVCRMAGLALLHQALETRAGGSPERAEDPAEQAPRLDDGRPHQDPQGAPEQPGGDRRGHPEEPPGRGHGRVGLRQVLSRLRHALPRRPPPLPRDPLRLRAP